MTTEPRRAGAAFVLTDGSGRVSQSGEAEAVIGDDALTVGPVSASYLDADAIRAADYRIEVQLWPNERLVLSQLGRRFDTFAAELTRVRNQARVAGLLAHGITMPQTFTGAILSNGQPRPAELQVYDTHVTIVPVDEDPWQIPFGAIMAVRDQDEPPGIMLETTGGLTVLGLLGRRREACETAIRERMDAQRQLLADLTGAPGFTDGWGRRRSSVAGFDELVARFAAPERQPCAHTLLALASGDARLGFVQLLDPDADTLSSEGMLPPNWAAFLLVPVGALVVLEIVAGPAAATYVFRGQIEAVNADLQLMHFRRAPLALTAEQAVVTRENPHRLALRKLAPLARLRSITTARLVHNERWVDALRMALLGRA